jgi:hypothetical protein
LKKEDFRFSLKKYINGGCLEASDKLLYPLSPQAIFRKNASVIKDLFSHLNKGGKTSSSVSVTVEVYKGENEYVKNMISFLRESLKNELIGVYVHGSLGTQEEIGYSDFDALVILKDEILNDTGKLAWVAHHLNEARKFMFQMDPLQHHGWFVLTESDLDDYPESYFPPILFQHAKSLYADRGLELKLKMSGDERDYTIPFAKVCQSIQRKIGDHRYPDDAYQLKNLLSEFMLLPALYVQARDKQGIYKKFSFEEAKKDFSNEEWRIMEDVSLIRGEWNVIVPAWKKRMIASPRFFSFNLSKILSPGIPRQLNHKLDEKFYQSMLDFTTVIHSKIQ